MSAEGDLKRYGSVQRMLEALSTLTRSESTEKSYVDSVSHLIRHLGVEDPDAIIKEIRTGRRDPNEIYRDFLYKQSSSGLAPNTVRGAARV